MEHRKGWIICEKIFTSIIVINTNFCRLISTKVKSTDKSSRLKSNEISTTSNTNSKNEIITLEDIEKLYENQNINLVKKDVEQTDFNRLMQKFPIEYYLNGDKGQVSKVYVFDSEDERVKAKAEYDNKTATMKMSYLEIYEVKNIIVFLIAGESKNECYQKVSTMMQ